MRSTLPRRLVVIVLLAAIAFALYVANAGPPPSFASEGDGASQKDDVPTLESLTERIAGLENRIAEL